MRRISLSGVAKAKDKVSRSNGRVVASSQCYSTIPPPKDQDLEEEEDEAEGSLKKEFIPFPTGYLGGGGFLVDKKKETDNSTGTKSSSSSAKGTDMNYNYGQGTGKPDYGGGCSGCHGCSRCLGCSGGCRYRSGGSDE